MSEKVDGGNGKLYTRDHPHEIISPYVMRFTEIRGWIRELIENPAYGWSDRGVAGLARSLGYASRESLTKKLTTAWIWPKEQVRLTARLKDILDGRIVPTKIGRRVEGVMTEPPRPPVVPTVRTIALRATPLGLFKVPAHHTPVQKLPSFSRAFAEAIPWNPDEKKGRKRSTP